MSATTVTAPARATTSAARLTFPRLLRSEWIKLSTVRSTWWSIGIVAVLTVGIALLFVANANVPGFTGVQAIVMPIQFTMLLAGILGAISVTGEYSTGMIRSSLTADPRRGDVLAAKATVVALLMFVTSLVTFLLAALATAPIAGPKDMGIAWGEPTESILPILAASVSMAVFALIGVGFGFLLRNGAGAIAATVSLLFVMPIVLSLFAISPDAQWIADLSQYLPMSAAQSFILADPEFGVSAPIAALTLGAWVAAAMLSGWATLRSRDA